VGDVSAHELADAFGS
jgi:hypothetical protein